MLMTCPNHQNCPAQNAPSLPREITRPVASTHWPMKTSPASASAPWAVALVLSVLPCLHAGELLDRARALNGPLADVDHLLFTVADTHDDWFHPTGRRAQPILAQPAIPVAKTPTAPTPPARICRMQLGSGTVETLFEFPQANLQGMDLHPQGDRLVVSLRPTAQSTHHHLFELTLPPDRSQTPQVSTRPNPVRQLTQGPYADLDPVWLEDDSIVFTSTRSNPLSTSGNVTVPQLYRYRQDRPFVEPFAHSPLFQRHPAPLPDGRILFAGYTPNSAPAPLTTQLFVAPTMHQEPEPLYGLGQLQCLSFLQARPIPGSPRLVGIVTPGGAMTRQKGWLAVLDPTSGPDCLQGLHIPGLDRSRLQNQVLSPTGYAAATQPIDVEHPEFRYRHPWPLSERLILVTTDHTIELVDPLTGAAEILHEADTAEGELGAAQPVGMAKPPPLIATAKRLPVR